MDKHTDWDCDILLFIPDQFKRDIWVFLSILLLIENVYILTIKVCLAIVQICPIRLVTYTKVNDV